jgi:hypothetical protein
LRRYRLTRPLRPIDLPGSARPQVTIWVNSDQEDEDGELRFEGDCLLFERICEVLSNCYGMRARPLDGAISPLDLAVALDGRLMRPFEPQELP